MAWHLHLNLTTPNSLLTNAFLIISVINVSYCAIRLISHMQSIGSPWTRHRVKRQIKGPKEGVSVIMDYKHCVQKRKHTCIIHIFHALGVFMFGQPDKPLCSPQLCFGTCAWPSRCWIAAWLFQIWANIQTRPLMHSSIWFSSAGTAVVQRSVPCSERGRIPLLAWWEKKFAKE